MFGTKGGDKEVKYISSSFLVINFSAERLGVVFHGGFLYLCGISVFFLFL